MYQQPKNKILLLLIAMLLISNIVLLSLFFSHRPDGKRGERKSPMTAYLKTELQFSDAQMVQFDTIKSEHRRETKMMTENMRANKEQAFKRLGEQKFSDSAMMTAAAYSASQQKDLEVQMLKHLKDIRSICNPEQQAKFDSGFYKVMQRPKTDEKLKKN